MCQEEGCVGLEPTNQAPRKATDYFATDVWHRTTGSMQYYITDMQNKALKDEAPLDALFIRDGKWVCVSDLPMDHRFRSTLATYSKIQGETNVSA